MSWFKRDRRFPLACRAYRLGFYSLIVSAVLWQTQCLGPLTFTILATLGLVLELFVVEEELLTRGEYEICAAINAFQYLVLELHERCPFLLTLPSCYGNTLLPAARDFRVTPLLLVRPNHDKPHRGFTARFDYNCQTALMNSDCGPMNPGRSLWERPVLANPALCELSYGYVCAPELPSRGVSRPVLNKRNAALLL